MNQSGRRSTGDQSRAGSLGGPKVLLLLQRNRERLQLGVTCSKSLMMSQEDDVTVTGCSLTSGWRHNWVLRVDATVCGDDQG